MSPSIAAKIRKSNVHEMFGDAVTQHHDEVEQKRSFWSSVWKWVINHPWLSVLFFIILVTIIGYKVLFLGTEYQAVFLTNNQVYFGKLSKRGSDYPVLTDVYYVQTKRALQTQLFAEGAVEEGLRLVKLGSELHGSADKLVINREHILFIEDLREDSALVKAIRESKEVQRNNAK